MCMDIGWLYKCSEVTDQMNGPGAICIPAFADSRSTAGTLAWNWRHDHVVLANSIPDGFGSFVANSTGEVMINASGTQNIVGVVDLASSMICCGEVSHSNGS